MQVDQDKLLEGKREIKVKQGFFRCLHCGRDVERLYPMVYNINPQTFKKIQEIAHPQANVQIVSKTPCDPNIFKKLDDITLKPIHNFCVQISIDVCFSCVDKVGWRHKFLDKQRNRLYATKTI